MKNIIKPLFDALCKRDTPEDKLRAVLRRLNIECDRISKKDTYQRTGDRFFGQVCRKAFGTSKNESEQGSLLDTMICLNAVNRSRKSFMTHLHDQMALQNQEAQNIKFIVTHSLDIDRAIDSVKAQTKINSVQNPHL